MRQALLGFTVGPTICEFDPGRTGSYFQPPAEVERPLGILEEFGDERLAHYTSLLRRARGRSAYVTF